MKATISKIKLMLRGTNIENQFYRFLLVGILNTLFGYSVFLIGLSLGLAPGIALFFATIIGILFNFKTIGHLVFENVSISKLLPFIVQYALIYIINFFLLKELMFHFNISAWFTQLMLLLPMAILSFILSKFFVFRKTSYELN